MTDIHHPTQHHFPVPVLQGKEVTIGYKKGKERFPVHQGLNFSLYSGELTCLLGANGAGKSTLLRTLAASQPSLDGQVLLLGKPLQDYSEKERSRNIGVVLTDRTQAGGLTVYELVALGRQPHTGFFGRMNRYDKELVNHALHSVGIAHKAQSYTAELSDGERQKAMIAKALVQECPLILLDEPTAFLDVVSRIEIMQLLHRLACEEQKAILLSTHDVEQALVLADRLWLMSRENGLECGVTEDLIMDNRMDTLFNPDCSVRFDLMHGGFTPTVEEEKSIWLQAEDDTLRHWVQNALNRHGYLCLEPPQYTDGNGLLLTAYSKDLFRMRYPDGRVLDCTSFESLITQLR